MNQNEEFQQVTLQRAKNDRREVKLPKIQRTVSRGAPLEVKSSTKLPTLRSQHHIEAPEAETERRGVYQEDFVAQVEKKLRVIMQEQNILQIEEGGESDDENFQKKIHQNKEILKKVRWQQEKLKKENQQLNRVASHFNPLRKASHKNKNEPTEKRAHRESSPENIPPLKKKESLNIPIKNCHKENKDQKDEPKSSTLLKEPNNMNRELRQVKSIDEMVNINKILSLAQNKQSIQHEAKNDQRKLKKQYSHKFLTPIQKNQQLFDAIHNYLDNPRPSEYEVSSQKIIRERSQLQEKLRSYEQKLSQYPESLIQPKGSAKTQVCHMTIDNSQKIESVCPWKKLGLNQSCSFAEESSTFDQEVDKIGKYYQRNEKSLEKYVQNQKILVDMQICKRKGSNEKQ